MPIMKDKEQPRLPVVGEFVRHHGRLVEIQTIPPPPAPPPQVDYIFEFINARTELRLGGEVIQKFSIFNDFYGEGTSVEEGIKKMREYCNLRKIGPASELEGVVVKIVEQFRARPIDMENFYDRTFCDFESLGLYKSRNGLPEPVEEIVWSSKTA